MESDRDMDKLDIKWPDRLDNLFDFVILDEAHIIKQLTNKTWTLMAACGRDTLLLRSYLPCQKTWLSSDK